MVLARRPSAYLLALLASPLAVVALVGWTRLSLARLPADVEHRPALGAEALAVLAVERLWTDFDVERGADTSTLEGFRAWLDARGATVGSFVEVRHDGPLEADASGIVVHRIDRDTHIDLAFSYTLPGSTVTDGLTPLGTWSVSRRTWLGSDHALLGRDLGCALCHVTVRPAMLAAPSPVRVGVLGDLVLRGDARIDVHGTLHLGGALLGADEEPLAPQGCAQLRFAELGADLNLEAGTRRPLAVAPLEALDLMRLRAHDGLLLGRHRGAPRVLRRVLPAAFPGFDDVRPTPGIGATLAAARPLSRGLVGGRGGVVRVGTLLDDLDAGAPLPPAQRVPGHLWAVGTSVEPLCLEGDVEIDGDLVIGGMLQGRGSLRARGMIVVVGSLHVDGHLALVAGTDLLAGASIGTGGLVRFVREAQRTPVDLPTWITLERLGRMGERVESPLALEAYCYAPRHVIVVAPPGLGLGDARGSTRGDVRVRGGLVADVVAVHAPGQLLLEDDPEARALLELRAPLGLVLHAQRSGAPTWAVTAALGTVTPPPVRGEEPRTAAIVKRSAIEGPRPEQGSREAAPGPIESAPTDLPSARTTSDPR